MSQKSPITKNQEYVLKEYSSTKDSVSIPVQLHFMPKLMALMAHVYSHAKLDPLLTNIKKYVHVQRFNSKIIKKTQIISKSVKGNGFTIFMGVTVLILVKSMIDKILSHV